jgi:ankyrin repeat protein
LSNIKTTLTKRDSDGKFPLHHACRGASEDVITHLIDSLPLTVGVINNDGHSPLSIACQFVKSEEVLMNLIRQSPWAVLEKDKHGHYLLHGFLNLGQFKYENVVLEIIKKFPQAVTFSAVDEWENWPLHTAISHKQPFDVSKRLIEVYPVALEKTNDNGFHPIHFGHSTWFV